MGDAAATGARRLVEALERLGVDLVFGLPGVHNLPLWRALSRSAIRLVGVRHEQTAVYAADGYARTMGRLGVALVTTGPGAANTLGATGEAMAASSPVLVIATDVSSALRRPGVYRGLLHETRDQTAMFAPVTKGARLVTGAGELAGAVLAGAQLALAQSTGPVYLGVPTDLLRHEAGPVGDPPAQPEAPEPEAAALDRALELLARAERPLIWAGGGALRAGAGEAVGVLARTLAAPVVTTYLGRGLLAPDHPCAVPGPIHAREVGPLWDEADVVLAIGTDFDAMMTQEWRLPVPPALIAVTIDPADANKNYAADITLTGDARAVSDTLAARAAQRDGLAALTERLRTLGGAVGAAVLEDEPQAGALLDIMERTLPADAVVVADMCIPGYWLGGYRRVPLPRTLAYPMGWGTLGFGFPAAIGAALAGAGPVVCVAGDGGFLFACGELATVVQEHVALTLIVVDDGGYGMLRFDQQHAGEPPFGVDLARPDFTALAAAFGVGAEAVDGFGAAFETALAAALVARAPRVIVVRARMKPPPTTSPRWYRKHD
ncbi:MAG TPA: thiamine pyrophosphate-binding protein [Solirubrobacteraceae bacterium]|nr:thiamine pyrophosphate-binding protein [Solirubrobacteraceae bacterium]